MVAHGTWKLLSEELGISRVYVRSVAARNGWHMETRPVLNPKAAILTRLEKQFPCTEVPFGFYVSLPQEFRVSPQYVRRSRSKRNG